MVYLLKDKFNDTESFVVCTDMDVDTFNKFVKDVIDRNFTNEYKDCNANCSMLGCFAETFDNGRDNGFVFYDKVVYGMSVYEPTVIELE